MNMIMKQTNPISQPFSHHNSRETRFKTPTKNSKHNQIEKPTLNMKRITDLVNWKIASLQFVTPLMEEMAGTCVRFGVRSVHRRIALQFEVFSCKFQQPQGRIAIINSRGEETWIGILSLWES